MNDSPRAATRIETEFGQVSFACETYAEVIEDLLPLLRPHHHWPSRSAEPHDELTPYHQISLCWICFPCASQSRFLGNMILWKPS